MGDSDFATFLFIIISLAVVAGIVVFFAVLGKRSKQIHEESERYIRDMLISTPDDKKALFLMQYNNRKKNPTTAVLLALFLGNIGIHKFYLNKAGAGVVYILFCWTYIPGIIALIEAFTISGTVGEYNKKIAQEISMLTGAF